MWWGKWEFEKSVNVRQFTLNFQVLMQIHNNKITDHDQKKTEEICCSFVDEERQSFWIIWLVNQIET